MLLGLFRYLLRASSPRRSGLAWFDLIEIALVALGFLAYFLVRGAVADRTAEAFRNARWIIDLQASLGVWVEPQLQVWVLERHEIVRVMNFVYFWMDFPLIIAVGLLLFWRKRSCYTLLRDSLLISGAMALVLYWAFPVAPPRFLPEWGFVDTLERFSQLSYQAQSMQAFVNPYAAVPSLHVGWAALLAVVVFHATSSVLARAASLIAFVLQFMAVIATGNHYAFDGLVGLAVGGVALAAALWIQRRGYPGLRVGLVLAVRARRQRAVTGAAETRAR